MTTLLILHIIFAAFTYGIAAGSQQRHNLQPYHYLALAFASTLIWPLILGFLLGQAISKHVP